MKISKLLRRDMVLPELDGSNREDALRDMVAFLRKKNGIPKVKELFDGLLQRESLGSTAIGAGVAIPHCKLKGLKDPILMLAVSSRGIPFGSPDGEPSHLFFLVASSPENPSLNLQILAAIAHLVRKSENLVERILNARNIDAVLEIISEEEEGRT